MTDPEQYLSHEAALYDAQGLHATADILELPWPAQTVITRNRVVLRWDTDDLPDPSTVQRWARILGSTVITDTATDWHTDRSQVPA